MVKVIERLYQQHPDIRESINFVMADVRREEKRNLKFKRNLNKRVESIEFFVRQKNSVRKF